MLVVPKVRGFICVTAHPEGCAANVEEQIAIVEKNGLILNAPKRVLVVGSSTGYGLASRITAAFGGRAATIGVAFEKAPEAERCASAGWYNTASFESGAKKQGLYARSFNGDAFSDAMKATVLEAIKKDLGQIDALVYSLASPRRTHPKTGEQFKSVLKPIGASFTAKSLDTDRKQVIEVNLPPANEEDIRQTVAVMGGEDWELWINALKQENLLAKNFSTFSYSYIGPEVTWPIYKDGTIGRAKQDLERACRAINQGISGLNGKAYVSVNKAIVSQASSAIPVVPLYLSILMRVMKEAGNHEGAIEQIDRLWRDHASGKMLMDQDARVRIDNYEMEPRIQEQVKKLWPVVTTENLDLYTDFKGYQAEFLKLFGFGVNGVDYTKETNPMVSIPSLTTQAGTNQ